MPVIIIERSEGKAYLGSLKIFFGFRFVKIQREAWVERWSGKTRLFTLGTRWGGGFGVRLWGKSMIRPLFCIVFGRDW